MAAIHDRGKLIVGVSGDTLLFGARNPLKNQIEGFDIDMLKEVAKAIFGPDGESKISYKVITYADRLPNLEAGPDNGGVDIVAHTMTINCNRWLRIAFSSTYFDAGQRVLVKSGSGFTTIDALNAAKATVCAPEGSTNIELLRNDQLHFGQLVVLAKPDVTDCLVAMQQGQADAATGDDTVLAGLAAQDPNTEVVGDKFTDEPYGLGMAKDKVDFVRFVNGVIADMRTDGRWSAIYSKWLVGVLSDTVIDPPPAIYGREAP
jgi:polar amino acid transport system substrate-binding protein